MIENLPPELYIHTISYLPFPDLLSLCLTSKAILDITHPTLKQHGTAGILYHAILHDSDAFLAPVLTPEMLSHQFRWDARPHRNYRTHMHGWMYQHDWYFPPIPLWIMCVVHGAWAVLELLLQNGLVIDELWYSKHMWLFQYGHDVLPLRKLVKLYALPERFAFRVHGTPLLPPPIRN